MLRQIRSIRRSVTRPVLQSRIVSLVLTRLHDSRRTSEQSAASAASSPTCCCTAHLPSEKVRSCDTTAPRTTLAARAAAHPISAGDTCVSLSPRHWTGPRYLAGQLRRVADVESRRRLRSSATLGLVVPSTRHKTIGDRAFSITAARAWNSLLQTDVPSSASLALFRQRLKTKLFIDSFGANK